MLLCVTHVPGTALSVWHLSHSHPIAHAGAVITLSHARPPLRGPALLPAFVHPAPTASLGLGSGAESTGQVSHICPPRKKRRKKRRAFTNYHSSHFHNCLKKEFYQPNEKQPQRGKPKAYAQGANTGGPSICARPHPSPSPQRETEAAGGAGPARANAASRAVWPGSPGPHVTLLQALAKTTRSALTLIA